jgi:beta-lactam-binding protein with PASTA domain
MKRLLVIVVALAMLTGCGAGMFHNGAKIAVKNHETKKISLTDAIDELNTQYGEPIAHYRGYKDSEDRAHVIKDLYYSADDGRTLVTVTVIDDEVTQIITTKR